MQLDIISQQGWLSAAAAGSLLPLDLPSLDLPIKQVFFINTQTKPCTHRVYCDGVVRRLQMFHSEVHGLPDIRYNFLIGGDGTIYEGRGWVSTPELPKEHRHLIKSSIVISCIGPYTSVQEIPKKMFDVCWDLIHHGVRQGLIETGFETHHVMIDRDCLPEAMSDHDRA